MRVLILSLSRLKHNEGELKKKKADLKSTEKGYEKDAAVAAKLQKEKDKIEVRRVFRSFYSPYWCAMILPLSYWFFG